VLVFTVGRPRQTARARGKMFYI